MLPFPCVAVTRYQHAPCATGATWGPSTQLFGTERHVSVGMVVMAVLDNLSGFPAFTVLWHCQPVPTLGAATHQSMSPGQVSVMFRTL